MKLSISEMAKLSGVSVRTLHYYDEIGLLRPREVVRDTGYRYYDELSLESLQQILFYRELDFPLKEIVKIISTSEYQKEEVLVKQRELLKLKRKRLDKLIRLLDGNLKGEKIMSFKEFDMSEIEAQKVQYAKEVQEKWGQTQAFTQSKEKTANYQKADWEMLTGRMDELLELFSKQLNEDPKSEPVQKLVMQWQQWITDSYYDCTKEILAGLGKMYVADERFKANMDKFKKGTANFISVAIEEYCKNVI